MQHCNRGGQQIASMEVKIAPKNRGLIFQKMPGLGDDLEWLCGNSEVYFLRLCYFLRERSLWMVVFRWNGISRCRSSIGTTCRLVVMMWLALCWLALLRIRTLGTPEGQGM